MGKRAGWSVASLAAVLWCAVGALPATGAWGGGRTAGQEPTPAQDHSEEAYVVERYATRMQYEADGRSRSETALRIKVQSEAGVQQLGQLVLGYSSANQKLNVDYVRVLKADGSTVVAGEDAVRDLTAPISRELPMYTDFRQKHITVPALRPGEILEYKYTLVTEQPLAPGHFWMEYNFERDVIVLEEELEVRVPKDKAVRLKTRPDATPESREEGGWKVYRWTHRNPRRLSEAELEERAARERKTPPQPAIQMTTFSHWNEIAAWYAGLERERIVPTPVIRAKAEELTRAATGEREKAQALYDYVARNFRYVSLSFGVGLVQPHAAAEVLANQYGDCKDKHTLLAALLNAAGIRSSAVLISSGRKLDEDFPSPSQFDHVITLVFLPKAQQTDEALVWLDTTAEVAPFGMLPANLRKKRALVVQRHALPWESRVAGPELAETPADPPFLSRQEVEIEGKVTELGWLNARVKYAVRGDTELYLRTGFRRTPQTQWKQIGQVLAIADGFRGEVKEVKAGDPADTSKPFTFEYVLEVRDFLNWGAKRSQANAPLPTLGLPDAGEEKDGKETIELGSPLEIVSRLKLELPASFRLRAPVAIQMTRDYAEYKSTYRLEGNTLVAERRLTFRQREIPASRRSDWVAFRRAVRNDEAQEMAVEHVAASGGTPAIPETAKAEELYRTGLTALQSGNFSAAEALFKRVTELEPQHKGAWNDLGRAYLGQLKLKEAESAFRKQIEVNPFDAFAYNNLGRVCWRQQRYAEAEAAFRKQIEIDPLDRWAHGNLGQMLNEQKRYAEAVAPLEQAVGINPEDANLQVALGTALLNTGETEKALAAFDKAVELLPIPGIWNNIAYNLALKKTHLERAQKYAESAVAATSAELRNASLERISMVEMSKVNALAAYWDTLGWVYFQQGDLKQAEKYVRASWLLAQHGEVGDHLGQIYEKQGRKDAAMETYAQALAGFRPQEETRKRLAALAGGEERIEALKKRGAEALQEARTVKLGKLSEEKDSAEFLVLIDSVNGVEQVKFVRGNEKLRPLGERIRAARIEMAFPDEPAVKIVRRGVLSCSSQTRECVFVLMLPDNVTSVD